MSNKIATKRQLVTENKRLRDQLKNADTSLREIHSGEADAFFVSGAAGGEIYAVKGIDHAYRTIIENMGEGALTLTLNGLVLYANQRFAKMLRIPLEKVIGSDIFSWFAPESRQLIQTLLLEDMPDKRNEELVLTTIDGTQVPVYLSVNHLVLGGTDPVCIMVVTDLTRQKRNAAILAEQKLANAILEQTPDSILICDESGRIIRASKQAQMLSDKNPIGQLFVQAFPLRHLDGSDIFHDDGIAVKGCQSLEVRLEHNAKEFNFLISIGHLKDAQTKLLGSVVTLTDITERKQAELVLQTSEEFSRNMFVQAPLGIAVIDSITGQFYKVNPRFAVIAGRTTEEMENIDWLQITHPDDIQDDLDNMALLNTGKIRGFQMEKRYLHPNGTAVWIDMTISQLKTTDNISRHLCMIQDITERKQTENNRDQLANILESTTDLVITGDPAGHITYLNHAACTTLGLDPEEDITQMKVADFIANPDENPGLTKGVSIAIKKGWWSGDTVLKTRSGQEIPVSQV
ncbi:MAG TPA: PAS domain S-box protein, partial [Gammaproteobacteria bacterium]|nr:PAS domain S-box protein [Gammaproteobacteria bacterium]